MRFPARHQEYRTSPWLSARPQTDAPTPRTSRTTKRTGSSRSSCTARIRTPNATRGGRGPIRPVRRQGFSSTSVDLRFFKRIAAFRFLCLAHARTRQRGTVLVLGRLDDRGGNVIAVVILEAATDHDCEDREEPDGSQPPNVPNHGKTEHQRGHADKEPGARVRRHVNVLVDDILAETTARFLHVSERIELMHRRNDREVVEDR